MIGTDEQVAGVTVTLDQPMRTMLAYVVEGVEDAIDAPHDHNALVSDVADGIVARVPKPRDVTDILPTALEYSPLLERVDIGVEIQMAG